MMDHEVSNKAASAFQMDHLSVSDFHFIKSPMPFSFNGPINVQSNGATSAVYNDAEKIWRGTVFISLTAGDEDSAVKNNAFFVAVSLCAFFSFQAEDTPENKELFTQLLRTNGAFSVFSSMRGMVAAATSALGLSPGYITPFWNLNNYKWGDLPAQSTEANSSHS